VMRRSYRGLIILGGLEVDQNRDFIGDCNQMGSWLNVFTDLENGEWQPAKCFARLLREASGRRFHDESLNDGMG
jgi:hypothetical protein